jgi:tetratricopeptide (TPR) repeat protein
MAKAFELKERLPEKDRYMIEADYYSNSIETAEKSIQAYEILLDLDPEDWDFNNMLGTVYLKLEDWDKAIKHTGVGVKNRAPGFYPYYNLSNAYMALPGAFSLL